ncbi:transcriptional repressor [Nocardioides baekrokdamisoli]|uniref:Transcriptional repressor n=1 Tax=Nocardioides baekrokdamisoli TaxID=1804624 RepID=A0A3G9IFM2_9ACTN|nr:Fur family transcriptional regulator [Nocardioides baekrokdamisoli]BBH17142.1 transcriptional repressor [Nocardioides baekrokdamisoli]
MTTDGLRARLKAEGLRLTPQRELVLAAVDRLGHATPEDVLAEVRQSSVSLNLSTVYRTLDVLEQVGLVRHAHLSDRGATYHSVGGPAHFHAICRKCERVRSVDVDVAAAFAERVRADLGFVIDVDHLTIFGDCEVCE